MNWRNITTQSVSLLTFAIALASCSSQEVNPTTVKLGIDSQVTTGNGTSSWVKAGETIALSEPALVESTDDTATILVPLSERSATTQITLPKLIPKSDLNVNLNPLDEKVRRRTDIILRAVTEVYSRLSNNDSPTALRLIQKLSDKFNDVPRLQVVLAQVHAFRGEQVEARRVLQGILQKNPGDSQAQALLRSIASTPARETEPNLQKESKPTPKRRH